MQETVQKLSPKFFGGEIYELMQKNGVRAALPAWKPDGFALKYWDEYMLSNGDVHIGAKHQSHHENILVLSMILMPGIRPKSNTGYLPRNRCPVQEKVILHGTMFTLRENLEQIAAYWSTDTVLIETAGH